MSHPFRTPKVEREPTGDELNAAIAEVATWERFSGNKDEVAMGIAKWFALSNDLLVAGIDGTKLSSTIEYWNRVKNRSDVAPKRKALGLIQQLGGIGQAASWLDDNAAAPVARRFAPVGAAETPRSPIAEVPRAEIKPLQVASPVKQTEGMSPDEIFGLIKAGFDVAAIEKMWEVRKSLKAS